LHIVSAASVCEAAAKYINMVHGARTPLARQRAGARHANFKSNTASSVRFASANQASLNNLIHDLSQLRVVWGARVQLVGSLVPAARRCKHALRFVLSGRADVRSFVQRSFVRSTFVLDFTAKQKSTLKDPQ
jgi:hypothetical protein